MKGKEEEASSDEEPEEEDNGDGLFGKKQGAYLSWHNLSYEVKTKIGGKKTWLQLLHNVSGYVKPGMLLALMGSSGAGKSTLLDVLARRKTGGKITGEILINGHKVDKGVNQLVGYVEQQDIHLASQTVLEALEFSALCRLPNSIPRKRKLAYAKSLLKPLGLEEIAHTLIGTNAHDGISNDQRKRVTIAVELAANPSILFLDEPTSGLDSLGATRVMTAVKRISELGTPVICTIHQPSATVFSLFTHLLLLRKGGYVTYFGNIHGDKPKDFATLLNYFSDQFGAEIQPHKNPADFMLEVIGAGIKQGGPPAAPPLSKKQRLLQLFKRKKKKQAAGDDKKADDDNKKDDKESSEDEKDDDDEEKNDEDDENQEDDEDKDNDEDVEKAKKDTKKEKKDKKAKDDDDASSGASSSTESDDEPQEIVDPFVAAYRKSEYYSKLTEELEHGIFPGGKEDDEHGSMVGRAVTRAKDVVVGRYATPFYLQLLEVFKRGFLTYWRDPKVVKAKLLRALLMGLVMGTLFLQSNLSQRGASNRISLIYWSLLFANLTAISSIPKLLAERPVYYRERASATYHSLAYTFTTILIELPWTLICTVLYVIPMYFIGGLDYDAGTFFIFFALYLLYNLLALSLCQAVGCLAPNLVLANAMMGICFTLCSLFTGFLITKNNIPNFWIWMYYLDPMTYILEALVVSQMNGLSLYCASGEALEIPISGTNYTLPFCPITSGDQYIALFDMAYSHLLRDSMISLGYWLFLVVLTGLGLKFIVHQKR